MPAFPTNDPLEDAYTSPLSMGRVLIVYNTSVAYSLTLATRYARRKRIPLTNLFGRAFGTGTAWEPASRAAMRTVLGDFETLWTSVGAQIVLAAPGCPLEVKIQGVCSGPTGSYVWDANAFGYPDFLRHFAGAKRWNDIYDLKGEAAMGSLYLNASKPNWVPFYYASAIDNGIILSEFILTPGGLSPAGPFPVYWMRGTGTISSWDAPTWATQYDYPIGTWADSTLPVQGLIDLLGSSSNLFLPHGWIGWKYYNTGRGYYGNPATSVPEDYQESFDNHARAMEAGLRFAEAASPANRYRSPIHFQLAADIYLNSLSYIYSVLESNGYNVSFVGRAIDSDMDNYVTPANADYTVAQLEAGQVRDVPYHVMVGRGDNDEIWINPNVMDAWQPTAGGVSLVGPSHGWAYSLRGAKRGSPGGITHAQHITTYQYESQRQILMMLLYGLTMAEAVFFSNSGHFDTFPMGDPLMRPFPV